MDLVNSAAVSLEASNKLHAVSCIASGISGAATICVDENARLIPRSLTVFISLFLAFARIHSYNPLTNSRYGRARVTRRVRVRKQLRRRIVRPSIAIQAGSTADAGEKKKRRVRCCGSSLGSIVGVVVRS